MSAFSLDEEVRFVITKRVLPLGETQAVSWLHGNYLRHHNYVI